MMIDDNDNDDNEMVWCGKFDSDMTRFQNSDDGAGVIEFRRLLAAYKVAHMPTNIAI